MKRTLEDRQALDAAARIKRKEAKERKANRAPRIQPTAPGQRDPAQRDKEWLAWLHQGLPCIACLIEGPPRYVHATLGNPIEAAHQKQAIHAKGWAKGGLGPKVHDFRCVPICMSHHRLAPNSCDMGQRKFWDRLGIGDGIADLCAELYAAFKAGNPGAPIIRRYASEARS